MTQWFCHGFATCRQVAPSRGHKLTGSIDSVQHQQCKTFLLRQSSLILCASCTGEATAAVTEQQSTSNRKPQLPQHTSSISSSRMRNNIPTIHNKLRKHVEHCRLESWPLPIPRLLGKAGCIQLRQSYLNSSSRDTHVHKSFDSWLATLPFST